MANNKEPHDFYYFLIEKTSEFNENYKEWIGEFINKTDCLIETSKMLVDLFSNLDLNTIVLFGEILLKSFIRFPRS